MTTFCWESLKLPYQDSYLVSLRCQAACVEMVVHEAVLRSVYHPDLYFNAVLSDLAWQMEKKHGLTPPMTWPNATLFWTEKKAPPDKSKSTFARRKRERAQAYMKKMRKKKRLEEQEKKTQSTKKRVTLERRLTNKLTFKGAVKK